MNVNGISTQTYLLTSERQSVQLTPEIEYFVQLDTLELQQDELAPEPPATGKLPLAAQGPLGTRLNVLA
jgi:hypothetical protein